MHTHPTNIQPFIIRQCLAIVVQPIIEQKLKEYHEFWNSHHIRSSRQGNCIGGIPNDLFDMPAHYGRLIIMNILSISVPAH